MTSDAITEERKPLSAREGADRFSDIVAMRAASASIMLQTHRFGSLFASPLWIEALTRTYGFQISAAVATRDGHLDSAVLFSRVSDVRGDRIISLPFCDYC